mmetsp:Transcript_60229/g.174453  ORF Transcript_60229/g.174453 Transcript_60229/m.174453 type:complete len:210 (+) Transcript_60229:267-896(+)
MSDGTDRCLRHRAFAPQATRGGGCRLHGGVRARPVPFDSDRRSRPEMRDGSDAGGRDAEAGAGTPARETPRRSSPNAEAHGVQPSRGEVQTVGEEALARHAPRDRALRGVRSPSRWQPAVPHGGRHQGVLSLPCSRAPSGQVGHRRGPGKASGVCCVERSLRFPDEPRVQADVRVHASLRRRRPVRGGCQVGRILQRARASLSAKREVV